MSRRPKRLTRERSPAPGQMIAVGGHCLHLNRTGTGSPTVVIEAGLGDSSGAWSTTVQPGVAKTTRVCTYDRAGMGYSEPGPLPRTAECFVGELRILLHNGNVPGPYVLVGHSAGGAPVLVFAHEYPAEVAGVVLIESMIPVHAEGSDPASVTNSEAPAATGLEAAATWMLELPA
ncbi:MAG: alpha/beta fold hydrolase [Chloroflexi bacterium]|nr:alpha/beta fold hydrolase [Chloroflexota bacterium]